MSFLYSNILITWRMSQSSFLGQNCDRFESSSDSVLHKSTYWTSSRNPHLSNYCCNRLLNCYWPSWDEQKQQLKDSFRKRTNCTQIMGSLVAKILQFLSTSISQTLASSSLKRLQLHRFSWSVSIIKTVTRSALVFKASEYRKRSDAKTFSRFSL